MITSTPWHQIDRCVLPKVTRKTQFGDVYVCPTCGSLFGAYHTGRPGFYGIEWRKILNHQAIEHAESAWRDLDVEPDEPECETEVESHPDFLVPIKPTWGIIRHRYLGWVVGQWETRNSDGDVRRTDDTHQFPDKDVLGFVALTTNQAEVIRRGWPRDLMYPEVDEFFYPPESVELPITMADQARRDSWCGQTQPHSPHDWTDNETTFRWTRQCGGHS